MTYDVEDTIAAIASPPGGAARGIVRLSGPRAVACVERVFRPDGDVEPATARSAGCIAGTAQLELCKQPSGAKLPADLYLWPTDRSYTRQPVAELHTLGSPPLLDALLQALCRAGARPAQPGEFTLRAFLAGRLDLPQAEAVLGVIGAEAADQLDAALGQLAGGLSGPLHSIRDDLIDVLAELEAGLDFVDEDVEFISATELDRRLAACEAVLAATLDQLTQREDRPADFRVALVGPPNAGKSSLFNALVHRFGHEGTSPALVSAGSGTTRDYLVARLELSGRTCELVDTAGTTDAGEELTPIEAASDLAGRQQHRAADLLLDCLDATTLGLLSPGAAGGQARSAGIHGTLSAKVSHNASCWPIITKSDLAERTLLQQLARRVQAAAITSTKDRSGVESLAERIAEEANSARETSGTVVAATASRCRDSLQAASECLAQARSLAANRQADELIAVEIREALERVGLVVGAVYTDDILDRVFSRFCIGK